MKHRIFNTAVLPGALCSLLTISAFTLGASARAEPYDLEFCTFIGGSKWERVQSLFVDAEGFVYVAGSTKSANFPTTTGAYDTAGSANNSNDGFVAKLAPDGTSIIWSTYLHGTDRDDVYGVYADPNGFVYAVGWTRSSNFPTTPGAYDRTHNGDMDVFAAKLEPDGASLVYSTFLGGSGTDQCRGAMDFDQRGAIYLAGYTDSTNFPATPGAIQRTFKGGYGDAFVAKLSPDGASLLFATYLGSTGPDHAFPGLRVHSDGSIIVTGAAGAADFPTTAGAYQRQFAGTEQSGVWYGDAFVARFSLTPANEHLLHYITFFGGSGMEKSTAQHGIALDEHGNAVIAITTHSADFPTTTGAFQRNLKGKNNICIATLSADGTTLLASTYLGGSPENGYEPSGLCLDAAGNVFVTGSIFGGASDHPVTSDAFRPAPPGGNDAFFA
ncbi:MAG: SBBP repeat-containing protein, partial [Phycisphaerales bacterium]